MSSRRADSLNFRMGGALRNARSGDTSSGESESAKNEHCTRAQIVVKIVTCAVALSLGIGIPLAVKDLDCTQRIFLGHTPSGSHIDSRADESDLGNVRQPVPEAADDHDTDSEIIDFNING